MAAQTFKGFLLTRNWRDSSAGIELEFWFSTQQGPLCARVHGQRSVFFLAAADQQRAQALLGDEPGVEVKPVELRDFAMRPVVAVYWRSYRAARRCAQRLREQGLEPLESDINPADRYLMERFIAGSALLQGEPRQRERSLLLDDPIMKSVDHRPQLKMVSFDIETAMEGVQL